MLIETYGKTYLAAVAGATPAVPTGTPLGSTAAEILEMVSCYAYDGMIFFRKGDLVNAVASFAYGYGWLDAGCMLGFADGNPSGSPEIITEEMPIALRDHLSEKTGRYRRMLAEASDCTVVLPDSEIPMYREAMNIQVIISSEFDRASQILSTGDETNALIHYSYGYGWLDCGVRAGIFRITGDRHLFTI